MPLTVQNSSNLRMFFLMLPGLRHVSRFLAFWSTPWALSACCIGTRLNSSRRAATRSKMRWFDKNITGITWETYCRKHKNIYIRMLLGSKCSKNQSLRNPQEKSQRTQRKCAAACSRFRDIWCVAQSSSVSHWCSTWLPWWLSGPWRTPRKVKAVANNLEQRSDILDMFGGLQLHF